MILILAVSLAFQLPAGKVEGRVVNSVSGQPVAGVTVVLQGSEPTGNPPQPDSYIAETDGSGVFRVESVVPGPYEAKAQREGFTAKRPLRLTVEAGRPVSGIALTLMPLGSISGKVLDPDGDPISDAFVEVLRYSYVQGKKQLTQSGYARSNDQGAYRVFGLPPGRYFVKASLEFRRIGASTRSLQVRGPKIPLNFSAVYFPNARDVTKAVELDVPAGAELSDTNLQLRPELLYTIRGRISGAVNQDSELMITFSAASGSGPSLLTGARGPSENRVFRFPSVLPGAYVIEAVDRKQGLHARQLVEVVNSDVDAVLALAPERTLSGIVRAEAGARFDVDRFRLQLEAGDSWNSASAAAKPDGSFSVARLQAISYDIRVNVPGGAYLKSIRIGDRDLAVPRVDLAKDSGALTVTLSGDSGKLEGSVSDSQGQPIEGAVVVLAPDGRLRDWTDLTRTVTANRDGRFELRDLAPGDYKILAFEDAEGGAVTDPAFRKPYESRATAIRIEPNGREEVKLKALALTGRP